MNITKNVTNAWSAMTDSIGKMGTNQKQKIKGLWIEVKAMQEYAMTKFENVVPQRLKLLSNSETGATLMEILGYGAAALIFIITLISVLKPKIQPYIDGWFNKVDAS